MAISHNAVSRLPLYRAAIVRLHAYGAVNIYSSDIADSLGLTAAQVRKDFSMFKFAGKKKVGYDADFLLKNIDLLLGKNEPPAAILCCAGPDGSAFLADQIIDGFGFSIVAAFEDESGGKSPAIDHARRENVPILPFEELIPFVTHRGIAIGIIATPAKHAQRMLDLLVIAGVQGVLNLSGAELKSPKQCVVNSVNVVREFEKLVYYVKKPAHARNAAAL